MTTQAPTESGTISIRSRALGDIEFAASDVIDFCEPLLGFPDCTTYVLVPHTLADGTLSDTVMWLQATVEPFHAFILTDPWSAVTDYAPEIPDQDAAQLELSRFEDAKVMCILTVPSSGGMTINLRAPIVFNVVNRRAKQVVLHNEQYHSRHEVGEPGTSAA